MRNRFFLHPEYFAMLRKHGVAHIYNSWTDMPSVKEQMKMPESRRSTDLVGARFLLKPGRKYEDAVKKFSPYAEAKEENEEARAAGAALIERGLKTKPGRGAYLFVNNRLEGNAPTTILSIVERAGVYEQPDRVKFRIKTTFGALPIGSRFLFHGRVYLKEAPSMTQDAENNGAIFMDEAEVEAEKPNEPKPQPGPEHI
jgi:hypothetical protein